MNHTISLFLAGSGFLACAASAQVVFENFDAPAKQSNAGANASLGAGGAGFNYDVNFGTWMYNDGNMGIDNPAEGAGDGSSSGNAISSLGLARVQDWRGTNARAVSVIFDGSLFSDGMDYTVSFDVIGDASGNDAGRYWLAELSGYDTGGSNFIQIDGTHAGWGGGQKPFVGNGTAIVNYLADSASNGVLLDGETDAGTSNVSFGFTYSAGTDVAFAVGTYNNIFAIDDFSITAIPEPSVLALLGGMLSIGLLAGRRRR